MSLWEHRHYKRDIIMIDTISTLYFTGVYFIFDLYSLQSTKSHLLLTFYYIVPYVVVEVSSSFHYVLLIDIVHFSHGL